MLKNKKKCVIIILLIIIMLLQIIAVVYGTSKREYYHIDEYYSHGLMQYKTAFIFENEDYINNWHNKDYFEEYLIVNKGEKFDISQIIQNQEEDVHPPLYYILLRAFCNFNTEEFSIWPGTILNIILFIISTVIMFLIAKKVFKNSYYALLICLISGFCIASVETVMYVRMYQLLILEILLTIYWHISKNEKDKLSLIDIIQLIPIIVCGFLTHYYYCIVIATLYFMYIIKYAKKKEWNSILKYTSVMIISAVIGISIFPHSIFHMFFSYRGVQVTENIFNINNVMKRTNGNMNLVNTQVFNGYGYIILAILIISCAIWLITRKKHENNNKQNSNIKYVIIPTIIYLIVITIASPYIDLRYSMPVVQLIWCSIIFIIKDILEDVIKTKYTIGVIGIIAILVICTTIPLLSNNLYTYKEQGKILEMVEEKASLPCIYSYEDKTAQYNKIMECYEALTKIDKTYIMKNTDVSCEKIENTLKGIDISNGILIIKNDCIEDDVLEKTIETNMFKEYSLLGRLGEFGIYLVK